MSEQLSVDTLRQIDAACDKFEEEWRTGKQPRLENFLREAAAPVRTPMLESLQRLQQELIFEQLGPAPAVSDDAPSGEAPPAPSSAPTVGRPSEQGNDSLEKTLDWNGARVILRVTAGPHQGLEFVYDEHDTLLAGRSSEAQLRLKEDAHFSRNHFRLEVNPPTCFLMDLRSRNGTFVNGDRVAERYLKDGDLVSGGRTRITVSILPAQIEGHEAPPAGKNKMAPHQMPRSAEEKQSSAPGSRRDAISAQEPKSAAPGAHGDATETVHIKGYEIYEQIGAGDLGRMFRATRLATGEQCALKVISPAARADEKAIQSFLREASILNQLQHANIVRMVEMGASGTDLFLSNEFLETLAWQELAARWSATQRIRIACGLMAQILGALDYAHARSLVHRDVKPGNVLIHRTDGKLAAKLADFGLAKQYTTAGLSQMTREGDVIGSLPYMSPEQFINSREAKPTCDIYSAAATLYWMISGQEPILLENHPCKFLAILEDPPVPIQHRVPEVSLPLAQLVHRGLEKKPDKRFASAAEMRQQLRAFAK